MSHRTRISLLLEIGLLNAQIESLKDELADAYEYISHGSGEQWELDWVVKVLNRAKPSIREMQTPNPSPERWTGPT